MLSAAEKPLGTLRDGTPARPTSHATVASLSAFRDRQQSLEQGIEF